MRVSTLNINRQSVVILIQFLFKNYMYVSMGTLIIYMAIFYNFDFLVFAHQQKWDEMNDRMKERVKEEEMNIGKTLYERQQACIHIESIYYGIKA